MKVVQDMPSTSEIHQQLELINVVLRRGYNYSLVDSYNWWLLFFRVTDCLIAQEFTIGGQI